MLSVHKEYTIDSAHFIKDHPKCGILHGHTWTITVGVKGYLPEDGSMLIDFHELNDLVRPLLSSLDHKVLNDVVVVEKGKDLTAETLAVWLHQSLRRRLLHLSHRRELSITVKEGNGGWATYEG